MAEQTTGAMQEFGAPAGPGHPAGGTSAGFVLLYAEAFEKLPAAWPLASPSAVIGREGADLTIPINAVSRRHAEVTCKDGRWSLTDLGSRNGTLVDGTRVEQAVLEPAHEVRVGDAILKFVDRHAETFARYRIDGAMLGGAERKSSVGSTLVGGYQMDHIAAELERIAPTELAVMLLGESGTGKEVAARELHSQSGRRGPFCAINCAAIPGSLIESELFGFRRGAFSGADRDKPGLIKAAHEGTLLLDEIGDMPLEAQAKLLRVLQSKEVLPLGATTAEHVDVRIVCATHRDLGRLQAAGAFRPDLFARLNEYQVYLPPLRERKEDVYLLVRTFLERHGKPELCPTFPFMAGLLHYDWPYNVRELEACVKRCVALSESDVVDQSELPEAVREAMRDYARPSSGGAPSRTLEPKPTADRVAPTAEELKQLLRAHQGNVAAVGRELGKARMQVHRWMKRYDIDIDDYREPPR
jgi:transcriptional regulator with PAS, ATPase and Fis domain